MSSKNGNTMDNKLHEGGSLTNNKMIYGSLSLGLGVSADVIVAGSETINSSLVGGSVIALGFLAINWGVLSVAAGVVEAVRNNQVDK